MCDIIAKNLGSGSQVVISGATNIDLPACPAIGGDVVVWNRTDYYAPWPPGSQQIVPRCSVRGVDLVTGTEYIFAKDMLGSATGCATDGKTVVWSDDRNGNWDIYGYDLVGEYEYPICTDPGDQVSPNVDGDVVVWLSVRDQSTADLYGTPEPSTVLILVLGSVALVRGGRKNR
jgi:beta propeller repeat protein